MPTADRSRCRTSSRGRIRPRRSRSCAGSASRTRRCCSGRGSMRANGDGVSQFLIECLPSRTRRNMLQILAISKYSRSRAARTARGDRAHLRRPAVRHPADLHRPRGASTTPCSAAELVRQLRHCARGEDTARNASPSSRRSHRGATGSSAGPTRRPTRPATRSSSRRRSPRSARSAGSFFATA